MSRSIKVKGHLQDFQAFQAMASERKKRIGKAPASAITSDPMNDLARRLHPDRLFLKISEIRDETKSIKSFRLVPDPASETKELPVFRAGQYLSFKVDVGGTRVSRPYSICSSPAEALKQGFVEISVRKKDGGFVTEHIWKNWSVGTRIETSGPCGFFYYDSIRDSKKVVGLAGGCGFTPFRSMIKDMFDNDLDLEYTLLFGIRTPDEIIFEKELREFESRAPDKFKMVYVCSEPDDSWAGPSGFLTKDCITEHAGDVSGASIFICGPPAMYNFLEKELKAFNLPRKNIRREVFGEIEDVTQFEDFPPEAEGKTFDINVHIGNNSQVIPGRAVESVLVALERAGLAPPSQCRSGECGFCDSILLSGDIFVSPENDGRREAGKKFGHFHPCSSYPVSDLEIKVLRDIHQA